jgi:hypothetical protein
MRAFKSQNEQCIALEDAFRKLTIRRGNPADGIPYDALIPGLGRQLLLMRPSPGARRQKVVFVRGARGELRRLAVKVGAVIKALEELSETSDEALNFRKGVLVNLTLQLSILEASANHAEVLRAPPNALRGAPIKTQPRKITQAVAQHYYCLTGRAPTRNVTWDAGNSRGAFVERLKTVYAILGVKASADSQAKAVAKEWRSSSGRPPSFRF